MIKKGAKILNIKEQVLFEDACGLTIEFAVKEDDAVSPYRLRLYGKNLEFGNREILFDKDGVINGAGTFLGDHPFPFED